MADIVESSNWESGVYQLETDDPVLGGTPAFDAGIPVTGHANAQAQQLANRTKWLKDTQETFVSDLYDSSNKQKGSALVGRSSITVENLFNLISQPQRADLHYIVRSTVSDSDASGNRGYYWSPTTPKSAHDGYSVVSPTVPWTGSAATMAAWISGEGETDPAGVGCFVSSEAPSIYIPKRLAVDKLAGLRNKVIRVFAGIDSLTAGAGTAEDTQGISYFGFLQNSLMAHFGDAGPGWCGIDNYWATQNLMNFSYSGFSYIKTLDKTTAPAIYSLDFSGMHAASATPGNYILMGFLGATNSQRDWGRAKLYYLQQPGGATFTVKQVSGANITVNTDGALSLQSVEITRQLSAQNQLRIDVTVGGVCTVFGYWMTRDVDSGVICSRMAFGGYKIADFAGLDATFQQQWLSEISPTHYLFNGGTNDIGAGTTPSGIYDLALTYLSRFPASTQKVIIAPNEVSGESTDSSFRDYRLLMKSYALENNLAYIDNREALGSYSYAQKRGLMTGTTHPSEAGSKLIAAHILDYMEIPVYPYTGFAKWPGAEGGSSPVYRGVLQSKGYNGVVAGATQEVYELSVLPSAGAYLLTIHVCMRDSVGNGQKSSLHRLRVGRGAALNVIGTLTTESIYDDSSTTETYTLAAAVDPTTQNIKFNITAGAGNVDPINIGIHAEYMAAGTVILNGEQWSVV